MPARRRRRRPRSRGRAGSRGSGGSPGFVLDRGRARRAWAPPPRRLGLDGRARSCSSVPASGSPSPRSPSRRCRAGRRRRFTAAGRSRRGMRASSLGLLVLTPVFTHSSTATRPRRSEREPRSCSTARSAARQAVASREDVLRDDRRGRRPSARRPPCVHVGPRTGRRRGATARRRLRCRTSSSAPSRARSACRSCSPPRFALAALGAVVSDEGGRRCDPVGAASLGRGAVGCARRHLCARSAAAVRRRPRGRPVRRTSWRAPDGVEEAIEQIVLVDRGRRRLRARRPPRGARARARRAATTSTGSRASTTSPQDDAEQAIRDGLVRAIDDAEQAGAIGGDLARHAARRSRGTSRSGFVLDVLHGAVPLSAREPAAESGAETAGATMRARGRSSVGRASASQAVGRGFESLRPLRFQAVSGRSDARATSAASRRRSVTNRLAGDGVA